MRNKLSLTLVVLLAAASPALAQFEGVRGNEDGHD